MTEGYNSQRTIITVKKRNWFKVEKIKYYNWSIPFYGHVRIEKSFFDKMSFKNQKEILQREIDFLATTTKVQYEIDRKLNE